MAEFLFNRLAARAGLEGWGAASCGIAAQNTFLIPGGVKKALAKRGILEVEHTPQLVSRRLAGEADAVYAMAAGHEEVLKELYPEHSKKVFLFREAAGMGREDVQDPIGRPDETYEECCSIIEEGVRRLIQNHAKPAAGPRS